MSVISSQFGNPPGFGSVVETYEAAIEWGPASQILWFSALINANAVDSGNTPTYKLRPGLVLGQITANGLWTNYSATATDGSQIASGVLAYGLRMQDVFSGVNTQKYYAIVVGGRVKGANLLGLDNMARAQMAPRFTFDDNLVGFGDFPILTFITKTANYSILPTDNFTQFDNTGAVGEVDFTLPPIANGYCFYFRCVVAQTLKVISFEGNNVIGDTATRSSASVNAIGGGLKFYTNQAGTKWNVEQINSAAQTVSFL